VEELVDRLSLSYASLSPQLQRAALVVLDNPNDVAVNSMRTLATRAKVSPPTMLRLAQRMGFQNYEDFRDVFKRSVATQGYGDRADNLRRSTDKEGIAALVDATAVAAEAAFERFHDPMFSRDIERVADLIIAAERRFVLASGASFGQGISFQYVCRMALPDILLVNGFGIRAIDDIASVRAKDVVLAISTAPYSSRTVEAAIFAKQRGAEIVAVTDNRRRRSRNLRPPRSSSRQQGPTIFHQ
jgi:DNA-binding MurR/RpiR family transcriptional regulator